MPLLFRKGIPASWKAQGNYKEQAFGQRDMSDCCERPMSDSRPSALYSNLP
jgi:hypothetical protein